MSERLSLAGGDVRVGLAQMAERTEFLVWGKEGPSTVVVDASAKLLGALEVAYCSAMYANDVSDPLADRKLLELVRNQNQGAGVHEALSREGGGGVGHAQGAEVATRYWALVRERCLDDDCKEIVQNLLVLDDDVIELMVFVLGLLAFSLE